MSYDPQRARHRPEPPADEPAPVDVLLDAVAADTVTELPAGVDVEVTAGGDVVVHTLDADVEITPAGDDVVVRTDDATIEVRAEADQVVVSTGSDDISIDTTPRGLDDLDAVLAADPAGRAGKSARLVLAALVAALVAGLVAARVRRSVQQRRP